MSQAHLLIDSQSGSISGGDAIGEKIAWFAAARDASHYQLLAEALARAGDLSSGE